MIVLLTRALWFSHSAQLLKFDLGDDKIVVTSYIGAPVSSGVDHGTSKFNNYEYPDGRIQLGLLQDHS